MALWYDLDRPLILASQSPRRRELLGRMGPAFTVVAPDVPDERSLLDAGDLEGSLQRLAERKAESVASPRPEALVLGTDTVVVVGGEVLGKPLDLADARRMLLRLSGRQHVVYSGVALLCAAAGFRCSEVAATRVTFREIPREELDAYLQRAQYRDKAGAYAIQEDAMAFVTAIDGCYYNVVGLPVGATIRLFENYQRQRRSGS